MPPSVSGPEAVSSQATTVLSVYVYVPVSVVVGIPGGVVPALLVAMFSAVVAWPRALFSIKAGGTGIGHWVCQTIVKAHGGKFELSQSRRFHIRLASH